MPLLILLSGLIYIIMNTLQTSFTIAGKRGLVSLIHFLSVLLWVFIVFQIVKFPIINGICFAIGSTFGMYITHKINLNQIFFKT